MSASILLIGQQSVTSPVVDAGATCLVSWPPSRGLARRAKLAADSYRLGDGYHSHGLFGAWRLANLPSGPKHSEGFKVEQP